MSFLLDDTLDAIAAPWGGELAMEILPLLDFDRLNSKLEALNGPIIVCNS